MQSHYANPLILSCAFFLRFSKVVRPALSRMSFFYVTSAGDAFPSCRGCENKVPLCRNAVLTWATVGCWEVPLVTGFLSDRLDRVSTLLGCTCVRRSILLSPHHRVLSVPLKSKSFRAFQNAFFLGRLPLYFWGKGTKRPICFIRKWQRCFLENTVDCRIIPLSFYVHRFPYLWRDLWAGIHAFPRLGFDLSFALFTCRKWTGYFTCRVWIFSIFCLEVLALVHTQQHCRFTYLWAIPAIVSFTWLF